MPSSSTDPAAFLAALLYRLVDVLRESAPSTFEHLVTATRGRTALVEVDGHRLRLSSPAQLPYRLQAEPVAVDDSPIQFRAVGTALTAILNGSTTLDRAVVREEIFVRGELADLLAVHTLVLEILAEGPIVADLRRLWHEWEDCWPHLSLPTQMVALQHQLAVHGSLVIGLPRSLRSAAEFLTSD